MKPDDSSPFWKSPALMHRSKHWPERYGARIPMRIKMSITVRPDPWCVVVDPKYRGMVLANEGEYFCTVNSHGAVCGICDDGRQLGVKPDEFEVIEWLDVHQPQFAS